MKINILSYNVAGAKVLKHLDPNAPDPAGRYIDAYTSVCDSVCSHFNHTAGGEDQAVPDIILLQECIGFQDHSGHTNTKWKSGQQILEAIFGGSYKSFFFPSLSSRTHPHPRKWRKYNIPDHIEAQQGYGICVRGEGRIRALYVDREKGQTSDVPAIPTEYACFEQSALTTGSYLGTRNTEPRLAIRGRIAMTDGEKTRYVNYINIHLTTLDGEREGDIAENQRATEKRMQQLRMILEDVLSAYQGEDPRFRIQRSNAASEDDVWIIGGDFNAVDDSEEITLMTQVGFVDGNPNKNLVDGTQGKTFNGKWGTKWSLVKSAPPIAVDYVFCGLKNVTFPAHSLKPSDLFHPYRASFYKDPTFKDYETDHAAVFAMFEIP